MLPSSPVIVFEAQGQPVLSRLACSVFSSALPSGDNGLMDPFLEAAIEEARLGMQEGGIPIGSVIGYGGKIIGRGHNRRVQQGSANSPR
jgi:hypothetical protein